VRVSFLAAPHASATNRLLHDAVVAVLCGGTLLVAMSDWAGIGGAGAASFLNGPVYDTVVLSAGVAALLKAREAPSERSAWLAIAVAIFLWGAAEVYWTAAIVDNPSAPYPSPADIGYIAFYPAAAAGLLLLVRARARELDWRLWMDGAIAALGTAALGAAFVFQFVADRTSGTALEVATTLAYPLGDIAMVALIVGVVALTRWRPGRTWALLLAGLAVMALADIAYTLQTNGLGALGGDWVEPFYLLSALFIGAAALEREAERIQPRARFDGWRELMVPGFFALVMVALFGIQSFGGGDALTTGLWAGTMLAVLARFAITIRENERLLEQVRADQLTGLGNQGRLQVDLAGRCSRAEEEPTTLVMLDLNGFKHYNDSFGHPAGDAMLTRLGGQLGEAIGADGFAYRIGGDEFAVLLDGDVDHGEAAKRAAEALSARGTGFDVTAAWGVVSIPAEADTAAAAMQLADVRMYARKESRRLAAGDQIGIDVAQVARSERSRSGEALQQRQ
jgi:two-component system cell cycle response regulator